MNRITFSVLLLFFYSADVYFYAEAEVRINPILNGDDFNETAYTTPAISKDPHFAPDSPVTVVAAVGAPAHIPCKARSLGAKSVSWIRHRDLHMLTVGAFPFTNDDRFSAHRDPSSGDWVLVIQRPQIDDSGKYECSISTKPVITHTVHLKVVVPATELLGGSEVFLDKGSSLNLTCVIRHSPVPPEFVLWHHRDKLVNYGSKGNGVEVETSHSGTITRSSLLVNNATRKNSGKYLCKPSNSKSVEVTVHVLESETPAAMQTTNHSSKLFGAQFLLLLLSIVCVFCCRDIHINVNDPVFHHMVLLTSR